MKTFTLSKKDLAYLGPLDSTMNGLNVAIQVYVINTVYKRLSIDSNAKGRYDLDRGELYIMEEKDSKPETPPVADIPKRSEVEKPAEAKPVEKPAVKN